MLCCTHNYKNFKEGDVKLKVQFNYTKINMKKIFMLLLLTFFLVGCDVIFAEDNEEVIKDVTSVTLFSEYK